MIAAVCALAIAPLAFPQDHSFHHPAGAVFAMRCADVPAALAGLKEAPIARLWRDDELQSSLVKIMASLGGEEAFARLKGLMGEVESTAALGGVRAASVSLIPSSVGAESAIFSLAEAMELVEAAIRNPEAKAAMIRSLHLRLVLDFESDGAAKAWKETARVAASQLGLEVLPEPSPLTRLERFGFEEGQAMVARFGDSSAVDAVGQLTYAAVGTRGCLFVGYEPASPAGAPDQVPIFDAAPGAWTLSEGGEAESLSPAGIEIYLEGSPYAALSDLPVDPKHLPFVSAGWLDAAVPMALRGGRWRIDTRRDGFHVRGFGTDQGPEEAPAFAGSAFRPADVTLADAGADVVHWTSMDGQAVADWVVRSLPSLGVEADIGDDLGSALGSSASLYVMPLRGLATVPDIYLTMRIIDGEAATRAMAGLAQSFNAASIQDAKLQSSAYRGARLLSLTGFARLGMVVPVVGLRPTLVLLDDVAALTTSGAAAKRWVRGRLKGTKGERARHKGFALANAPADAHSVTYGNWAKLIGDGYGFALGLTPLLDLMGSQAPDLKASDLPGAGLITRYFDAGTSWTRRVSTGSEMSGWHYEARTSFGPATSVLVPGFAAVVVAPLLFQKVVKAEGALAEVELRGVDNSIQMYFFEKGEVPASLGDLPEGSGSLLDPWGNPLRYEVTSSFGYRLWSTGANGRDELGEGDDLLITGG